MWIVPSPKKWIQEKRKRPLSPISAEDDKSAAANAIKSGGDDRKTLFILWQVTLLHSGDQEGEHERSIDFRNTLVQEHKDCDHSSLLINSKFRTLLAGLSHKTQILLGFGSHCRVRSQEFPGQLGTNKKTDTDEDAPKKPAAKILQCCSNEGGCSRIPCCSLLSNEIWNECFAFVIPTPYLKENFSFSALVCSSKGGFLNFYCSELTQRWWNGVLKIASIGLKFHVNNEKFASQSYTTQSYPTIHIIQPAIPLHSSSPH